MQAKIKLFAVALAAVSSSALAAANIVPNGDFQTPGENEGAANWPAPNASVSYPVENGNRFLRLTQNEAGKNTMIYNSVRIPAGTKSLKMSFKARWQNVQVGANSWFDARIMMTWKSAGHGDVPGAKQPGEPNFKGTSDGWQKRELSFDVPEGAAFLALMPALFQAKSGVFDLDDFFIEALGAEEHAAAKAAAAKAKAEAEAKKLAEDFKTYVWSTPIPVPDGLKIPPIKAEGNRLVAMQDGVVHIHGKPTNIKKGGEVWLQGVAIASMEWTAGGENILKSLDQAINVWGANVIRLAVKSNFWFGKGPWQKNEKGYRELVDKVMEISQQNGVYVVLDLHEYRAASGQHANFWRDAATRYKNHPGVIFGLLNEPHGISWEEWRDGGDIGEKGAEKAGVFSENNENLGAMKSIGLQNLIEVVRRTGARNLLSIGGLDWAYDLSGVLKGYALKDTKDGQGIMYETHVYPWKGNWQRAFLDAAEKFPILVGEVGCNVEPMPWQNGKTEDPATWAPDMIGAIQKYRLNWTAWCFHPRSSPVLLKNWDYEPSAHWGEPVMRALKGEKFEMKKTR